MPSPEPFSILLAEVRALCQAAIVKQDEAVEPLAVMEREVAALGACRGGEAFTLPQVEHHLPPALALARGTPAEGLAGALAACLPQARWCDVQGLYGAYPEHADFVGNYAFTLIAGGDFQGYPCPLASRTLYLGFTLQGPNTLYPGHYHQAVEIYMPVAGRAEWFRDSDGWRTREPGDFILHRTNEDHAMQSGDEPLLALFVWISDLDSDVFLTDE